jgi:hypothetical protein
MRKVLDPLFLSQKLFHAPVPFKLNFIEQILSIQMRNFFLRQPNFSEDNSSADRQHGELLLNNSASITSGETSSSSALFGQSSLLTVSETASNSSDNTIRTISKGSNA